MKKKTIAIMMTAAMVMAMAAGCGNNSSKDSSDGDSKEASYKIGIQQLQFGMAAAVNITKSFFSLALLLLANAIVSKLSDGYGLF